jgi:hypothetical protein
MKYKLKISKAKIIGLIVLAFFIIYLAYNSGYNPNYDFKSMNTAPKEYLDLFPDSIKKKMSVLQTLIIKFQNPISEFAFDDKKYFIQIFRLNVVNDQSLDKLITLSNHSNLMTNAVTYYRLGPVFDINYKTGRNKASHINLNLYGERVNTILRNDTIACFYSHFKIFSINYNRSDTTVIWSTTEGHETPIPSFTLPIDIIFIKKHKAVYFLVMSVNDRSTILEPNKLYNLISTKN